MSLDHRHDDLLNAIEDCELLSLKWGDVDGSLSWDEAEAIGERFLPGEGAAAVEALIEAQLLHTFSVPGSEERIRSRFAEFVRLLARSRQTFLGESWEGAPPLIADFRIDLRRRRYPRRDQTRDAAAAQVGTLSPVQEAVWRAVAPDRLAEFQVRATKGLLAPATQDRATIVTAGTGSGKTLAFYLPAFMQLVELATPEPWVKAIAIYPRNELLKDQLSDAYGNLLRSTPALRAAGRALRIGTFFGDTPRGAGRELPASWRPTNRGWVCPFLRCPCGAEMVWLRSDRDARREQLTCASCGESSGDALVLTRDAAQNRPPDILFTTTEMLNRSLSDVRRRALFGIRRPAARRPRLLLLDEAHTYVGTAGAQAALTLRRWRHAAGGPITWVGLSATLQEAPRFFADLTGVDASRITEVTPSPADMIEEGREYQLVLRGDPASRASLLSASIQAAMLIGRTLDPVGGVSEGRFGRRTFVFTDDLDVTHRLFDDLRDAEGYDRFGREDPNRLPLAVMRGESPYPSPESDRERHLRDAYGQRWRLPERIRKTLSARLRVGRTTSRDPGVDARADVIVATSALEVGFNDPTVGAVLQHKAPRNFASFLQRRGRAGRDRRMRPLTVTVLSDYGRDRSLFQSFEHLFDPLLPPQTLPAGNQYLLRMQAGFALLDWIADRPVEGGAVGGSAWRTAAQPFDPQFDRKEWADHVLRTVQKVVQGDPEQLASLKRHLCASLQIDDALCDRVLWEPPRSLLLEVVPTLLRRLFRNWELAWPRPPRTLDTTFRDHPLPDFVPRTLFSDLNLPEVEIGLPPATKNDGPTQETLPIQQTLAQRAPGRVTRRFGEVYGGLAHWFPLPQNVRTIDLPVDQYADKAEYVGLFTGFAGEEPVERPVYRPWHVSVHKALSSEVKPTSNSRMEWASGFEGNGEPFELTPPPRTAWRGLVGSVRFYLHRFRASVTIRRFAIGARAELRRPNGDQFVDVHFTGPDGKPAAVGYEFETDGLALELALPDSTELAGKSLDASVERGVRAAFFRRLVHADSTLPTEINSFQRAWLRQIFFLATARRALEKGESLVEAATALDRQRDTSVHETVMDRLLGLQRRALAVASSTGDDDDDAPSRPAGRRDRLERLRDELRAHLGEPLVRQRLGAAMQTAFGRGPERAAFLRRTLEATLADALLSAVTDAAPRHAAAEAMVVDVEPPMGEATRSTLWLTETTVGGAGILESIADVFALEPRRLFRALEAALEPSDLEIASGALSMACRATAEPAVAAAMDAVRKELGHERREAARRALLDLLESRGIETGRAFVVSLNARLLAPGLRPEHDHVVRCLLALWDRVEAALGIDVEPRELAVLALDDDAVRTAADAAGLFRAATTDGERVAVLGTLLWPRTNVLRRESLVSYNPFRSWAGADPALTRALLLDGGDPPIELERPDWCSAAVARLIEAATVRVEAPLIRLELFRTALLVLPTTAVSVDHLKLYPTLERVARDEQRLIATFVLEERV